MHVHSVYIIAKRKKTRRPVAVIETDRKVCQSLRSQWEDDVDVTAEEVKAEAVKLSNGRLKGSAGTETDLECMKSDSAVMLGKLEETYQRFDGLQEALKDRYSTLLVLVDMYNWTTVLKNLNF